MIKVQHTGNLGVVVSHPEKQVTRVLARILIQSVAVFETDLGAAVIVTQLDIYHPGDCVRAISS